MIWLMYNAVMDTPTTSKPKRREGRPLKYEDLAKLEADIENYFEITPQSKWLITGLAVHLGTSRNTLMEYEARPEFVNTVKGAKDRIEMAYELDLREKGNAGAIFGLKNFGWVDKTEVETDLKSSDGSMSPASVDPTIAAGFSDYLKTSTKDAKTE